MRRRIFFLCSLPALLLGTTYFLLVEYVIHEYPIPDGVALLLRAAGAALVFLFGLAALASAAQLVEAVTRPLRALLRAVEGRGTVGSGSPASNDSELRYLFLRIHTLVQQNRSGARAIEELESLRCGLEDLRRDLAFPVSEPRPQGPKGPALESQTYLLPVVRAFEDLKLRICSDFGHAERAATGILRALDAHAEGRRARGLGMQEAVRDVERIGSVRALDADLRAGARSDEPPGASFQEFREAMAGLRRSIAACQDEAAVLDEAKQQASGLRQTVMSWLQACSRPEPLRGILPTRGQV